ncbi:uncharacterized protein BDZ99DRAFT_479789 [Mytilinidion resinicola]|uniref:Protein kinase domain-containing protein n=1 Tax=Mytilinidion resinicola TaxID=574789 RepID=A0A6A6YES5_9PEZI|nr:uncharacterized protein BDZ99DRAFT_479789 [Mytilinidion resinicola]KAF2806555.1 hypothetical protein BDZ99DRAFT_479789 [Mytilinidion resinicola]
MGSYSDRDSIAILSVPVAEMDLATFLDLPHLLEPQIQVLNSSLGCPSAALLYLHEKKIRHEDLKPQNVLILGNNVLLTDFGFRSVETCLPLSERMRGKFFSLIPFKLL